MFVVIIIISIVISSVIITHSNHGVLGVDSMFGVLYSQSYLKLGRRYLVSSELDSRLEKPCYLEIYPRTRFRFSDDTKDHASTRSRETIGFCVFLETPHSLALGFQMMSKTTFPQDIVSSLASVFSLRLPACMSAQESGDMFNGGYARGRICESTVRSEMQEQQ